LCSGCDCRWVRRSSMTEASSRFSSSRSWMRFWRSLNAASLAVAAAYATTEVFRTSSGSGGTSCSSNDGAARRKASGSPSISAGAMAGTSAVLGSVIGTAIGTAPLSSGGRAGAKSSGRSGGANSSEIGGGGSSSALNDDATTRVAPSSTQPSSSAWSAWSACSPAPWPGSWSFPRVAATGAGGTAGNGLTGGGVVTFR